MNPWQHGIWDPDELSGMELGEATDYLSCFGWERDMCIPSVFKVWFTHPSGVSILFIYEHDLSYIYVQDPVFPCLWNLKHPGRKYISRPEFIVNR